MLPSDDRLILRHRCCNEIASQSPYGVIKIDREDAHGRTDDILPVPKALRCPAPYAPGSSDHRPSAAVRRPDLRVPARLHENLRGRSDSVDHVNFSIKKAPPERCSYLFFSDCFSSFSFLKYFSRSSTGKLHSVWRRPDSEYIVSSQRYSSDISITSI